MYVGMDNTSTKQPSWYNVSADGLSDKQTFNINHIYIFTHICHEYIPKNKGSQLPGYWPYGVTTIQNTDKVTVSYIACGISIINWSTPQN